MLQKQHGTDAMATAMKRQSQNQKIKGGKAMIVIAVIAACVGVAGLVVHFTSRTPTTCRIAKLAEVIGFVICLISIVVLLII